MYNRTQHNHYEVIVDPENNLLLLANMLESSMISSQPLFCFLSIWNYLKKIEVERMTISILNAKIIIVKDIKKIKRVCDC